MFENKPLCKHLFGAKKLVLVLATSSSVIETSKKNDMVLKSVFYIYYLVQFKKDVNETQVQALINSKSEVNVNHPTLVKELGLSIRSTDIGVQKINGTMLDTYGIVVAAFSVTNKANWVRFFEEIFLVANVSPEVVLDMSFLTLSGANVDFLDRELRWRTYTIEEVLSTIKCIELVGKKEFAAVALDPEHETFIIHVASLNLVSGIHPNKEAQIAFWLTKEVKIPGEYSDFTNVFSEEKALVLPEQTELNEHAIHLKDGKQPPCGPIYSLGPVELETLKTYIKTHLKTGFIRPFKFPAGAPILFDKKSDGSFCLCIDYWGLNNLTIKNRYPLPLIDESLDRLDRAKRFIQLDLTSAYHQMRIKEGDEWKTAFQTKYGHFKY